MRLCNWLPCCSISSEWVGWRADKNFTVHCISSLKLVTITIWIHWPPKFGQQCGAGTDYDSGVGEHSELF